MGTRPTSPGFSKWIGYAMVIHNLAEVAFLKQVWFGRRGSAFSHTAVLICYFYFAITLITWCPHNWLFFWLTFIGGSMDWTLVFTFAYLAYICKNTEKARSGKDEIGALSKSSYYDFIMGTLGGLFHVMLTIQPLVFGITLGNNQINSASVFGLFPAFIMYLYFAARQTGRLVFIGPSFQQVLRNDESLINNLQIEKIRGVTNAAVPMDDIRYAPSTELTNVETVETVEAVDTKTSEKKVNSWTRIIDYKKNLEHNVSLNMSRDSSFVSDKDISHLDASWMFSKKGALEFFKFPSSAPFFVVVLISCAIMSVNVCLGWYAPVYINIDKCYA